MRHRQKDQLRQRIAMEAARILAESGIKDFQTAKRKAVDRLGLDEFRPLPSNQEIEEALLEHMRLFHAHSQPQQLKKLRETAFEAMRFFSDFQPRLAGDVLSGSAGQHSRVELHLFCEYPEQVSLFLMEHAIPYEEKQKRVRYGTDQMEIQPVFRFLANEVPVELVAFPIEGLRRAPNSPVDGKPMARGDLRQVEALLAE